MTDITQALGRANPVFVRLVVRYRIALFVALQKLGIEGGKVDLAARYCRCGRGNRRKCRWGFGITKVQLDMLQEQLPCLAGNQYARKLKGAGVGAWAG